MKTLIRAALLAGVIAITLSLPAADSPPLDPRLEPLRSWLGKTWKGEFKNSTPEKPIVDVASWERALNGKAIRVLHSINDGAYGGESLIMWDEEKKAVTYHYFTTAGFRTTGSANGVTEVRGTHELRSDGTLRVKTEHLKNGEWTPGRDATYREDSKARVVFK